MVLLMTNGEGMRGGRVHHTIAAHPFLGEVETAPSTGSSRCATSSPACCRSPRAAASYAASCTTCRSRCCATRSSRDEPPELELGVVELADGRAALCMVLRPEERGRHPEITEHGGWRAYRAARG